jgi:hypothetical protein
MKKLVYLIFLTGYVFAQQIQIESPQPFSFVYRYHEKFPIVWSGPVLGQVTIQLSVDNGTTWIDPIGSGEQNNNYFLWNVSKVEGNSVKIKISETGNTSNFGETEINLQYSSIDYNYISNSGVLMWVAANGEGSHNPLTQAGGFYFPSMGNKTLTYTDGLLYCGIVNGGLGLTGTYYRTGLMPGRILESGVPANPYQHANKIFKIKKDWELMPFSAERINYENDYNDWPAEMGAPFEDLNGDGIFTKGIDKPKFIGDEVLFNVANDLDSAAFYSVFPSKQLGIETQITTFTFDRQDILKNVVFKEYKLINKSSEYINDMIISYWADDDLGSAEDDFVGCDTTLNFGYTWNSDNEDDIDYGYGINPPAVAHMMVQSPVVLSVGDTANFGFRKKINYRNIKISSFSPNFKNTEYLPKDPPLRNPNGKIEMYNLMNGLLNDGKKLVEPYLNQETLFPLCGDPVSKTGWFEGEGWPNPENPHDRRLMINYGNFNMAPGDTQIVIIAIFGGQGTDNINSITELRKTARAINEFYESGFSPSYVVNTESNSKTILQQFSLSQNYPNPFNPSTTIRFTIPSSSFDFAQDYKKGVMVSQSNHDKSDVTLQLRQPTDHNDIHVTLKVYDILGGEIATLVNENKPAGVYNVQFIMNNVSSGIYFYTLKAGGFSETKKMLLLR